MKIEKIVVIIRKQKMDIVQIYTNLPPPTPCFNNLLVLDFCTTEGLGVEYVKTNFGIEPIISERS